MRKDLLRAPRSMPICCGNDRDARMTSTRQPKDRDAIDQDQFLTILSREDALAADVVAPIDVPPFDRSNVDGFAVRSADLVSAGEATPVRMIVNDEVIA